MVFSSKVFELLGAMGDESMTCTTSDENYIYIGTDQGNIWRVNPHSTCLNDATILFIPTIESYYIEKMEIISSTHDSNGTMNDINGTAIAILARLDQDAQVVIAELPCVYSDSNQKQQDDGTCIDINNINAENGLGNNGFNAVGMMDQLSMLNLKISWQYSLLENSYDIDYSYNTYTMCWSVYFNALVIVNSRKQNMVFVYNPLSLIHDHVQDDEETISDDDNNNDSMYLKIQIFKYQLLDQNYQALEFGAPSIDDIVEEYYLSYNNTTGETITQMNLYLVSTMTTLFSMSYWNTTTNIIYFTLIQDFSQPIVPVSSCPFGLLTKSGIIVPNVYSVDYNTHANNSHDSYGNHTYQYPSINDTSLKSYETQYETGPFIISSLAGILSSYYGNYSVSFPSNHNNNFYSRVPVGSLIDVKWNDKFGVIFLDLGLINSQTLISKPRANVVNAHVGQRLLVTYPFFHETNYSQVSQLNISRRRMPVRFPDSNGFECK